MSRGTIIFNSANIISSLFLSIFILFPDLIDSITHNMFYVQYVQLLNMYNILFTSFKNVFTKSNC